MTTKVWAFNNQISTFDNQKITGFVTDDACLKITKLRESVEKPSVSADGKSTTYVVIHDNTYEVEINLFQNEDFNNVLLKHHNLFKNGDANPVDFIIKNVSLNKVIFTGKDCTVESVPEIQFGANLNTYVWKIYVANGELHES